MKTQVNLIERPALLVAVKTYKNDYLLYNADTGELDLLVEYERDNESTKDGNRTCHYAVLYTNNKSTVLVTSYSFDELIYKVELFIKTALRLEIIEADNRRLER